MGKKEGDMDEKSVIGIRILFNSERVSDFIWMHVPVNLEGEPLVIQRVKG